MNVSYEWLKAFVPLDQSPTELRELITAHVATVDELVALRQDLAAFVIARVVEEAAHPDSDHLHVTRVDMGTGTLLDVVCGAPNVRAGKLYPFAPTGTVMPSGLTIQKRKIRGAISDGMLCSARELGLGEEQDGILEWDIDVPPGTPLLQPTDERRRTGGGRGGLRHPRLKPVGRVGWEPGVASEPDAAASDPARQLSRSWRVQ